MGKQTNPLSQLFQVKADPNQSGTETVYKKEDKGEQGDIKKPYGLEDSLKEFFSEPEKARENRGIAEVKEIIAEGIYSVGDRETPTVAESRALLQAKRVVINQAGTYIESY